MTTKNKQQQLKFFRLKTQSSHFKYYSYQFRFVLIIFQPSLFTFERVVQWVVHFQTVHLKVILDQI